MTTPPNSAAVLHPGGDCWSIPEYFALIARCCGRSKPALRLPRVALLGVGALFSVAHRFGVKEIPFDFTQARFLVGK